MEEAKRVKKKEKTEGTKEFLPKRLLYYFKNWSVSYSIKVYNKTKKLNLEKKQNLINKQN